MGIMRQASNNKIDVLKSKKWRKHRIRKAERTKREGQKVGFVVDAELTTVHHLRKRRTCARANITLSGKKKTKLRKQLRHMQKDKAAMEVIEDVSPKKTTDETKDTDMAEAVDESKADGPESEPSTDVTAADVEMK